jgi:hypothetical protein
MMAKDPEERYQEPIEVAEALAEWADQPIDPPPAKEMPGLCPLVLALTGHSVDRSGSSVPLGRVLFGPGRCGCRGGSSGRTPMGPTGSSVRTAASGLVTRDGSNPGRPRAAPSKGPISTARTAAANTAPIPGRSRVPADEPPEPAADPASVVIVSHRRTALFVSLALVAGVLFSGGAFIMYLTFAGR